MPSKLTAESINNRLSSLGIGATMIGSYLGSHVKTTFLYKCGHQGEAKPSMVMRGVGCNECRKRTKEDINLELDERKIEMVGDYLGRHVKTKFRFPCGHEGDAIPGNVLRGKGCRECHIESTRITKEDINRRLSSRGLEISGEYIDSGTKTEFTCQNGHKWQVIAKGVVNDGTGCPECAEHGGYKCHLPGWVYIIKFANFIKYGITNNPDRRMMDHKRTGGNFEIILLKKYEDGTIPPLMESSIKNTHGGKFVTKETMSNGWTETLPLSSLTSVLSQLQ